MTDWKQQLQDNWADWDFTVKLIDQLLSLKEAEYVEELEHCFILPSTMDDSVLFNTMCAHIKALIAKHTTNKQGGK